MAYFPLFIEMKGKKILVVGAGVVASRRIFSLLPFEAELTVAAREVSEQVCTLAEEGRITLFKGTYGELRKLLLQQNYFLVLAATGDEITDRQVEEDGRRMGAFVNVAGEKERSDFYFPGIAGKNGVTVGVTAGGRDHALTGAVTKQIRRLLDDMLNNKETRMEQRVIRIGSRESALAVAQTELIRNKIRELIPEAGTELVTMKTTGDRILDQPLELAGGKGLFVKELDRALLEGRCDLTVHCVKDMPMEVPEKLPIIAYSEREDCRDVLVLRRDLSELPDRPVIGTSSKRRKLQASRMFPTAEFKSIRGNILTRLNKLDDGEYDALILAAAGLLRLGLEERITRYFSVEEIIPAAGQGILAVQACLDSRFFRQMKNGGTEDTALFRALNNDTSRIFAEAERAFVKELDGGCTTPTAASARMEGEQLLLTGLYWEEESGRYLTGSMEGEPAEAKQLGIRLARQLKERMREEGQDE